MILNRIGDTIPLYEGESPSIGHIEIIDISPTKIYFNVTSYDKRSMTTDPPYYCVQPDNAHRWEAKYAYVKSPQGGQIFFHFEHRD